MQYRMDCWPEGGVGRARCDFDYGDKSYWCVKPPVQVTQVSSAPDTVNPDQPEERRSFVRCADHPVIWHDVAYREVR